MQIENHVRAIQADLAAAAALGGEEIAEAGRRLSDAVQSSLGLRLIDVLTEAALALSSALPDGHVEVRLAGRDPELVFVGEAEPPPVPDLPGADDPSARITLRLPEGLKAQVEAAADREGISTNAWVVRALSRALDSRSSRRVASGNRLQGFHTS